MSVGESRSQPLFSDVLPAHGPRKINIALESAGGASVARALIELRFDESHYFSLAGFESLEIKDLVHPSKPGKLPNPYVGLAVTVVHLGQKTTRFLKLPVVEKTCFVKYDESQLTKAVPTRDIFMYASEFSSIDLYLYICHRSRGILGLSSKQLVGAGKLVVSPIRLTGRTIVLGFSDTVLRKKKYAGQISGTLRVAGLPHCCQLADGVLTEFGIFGPSFGALTSIPEDNLPDMLAKIGELEEVDAFIESALLSKSDAAKKSKARRRKRGKTYAKTVAASDGHYAAVFLPPDLGENYVDIDDLLDNDDDSAGPQVIGNDHCDDERVDDDDEGSLEFFAAGNCETGTYATLDKLRLSSSLADVESAETSAGAAEPSAGVAETSTEAAPPVPSAPSPGTDASLAEALCALSGKPASKVEQWCAQLAVDDIDTIEDVRNLEDIDFQEVCKPFSALLTSSLRKLRKGH